MTTRQQVARLVPLVFLVILVAAGLRGEVAAPRWDGPLKSDGIAIGLAIEVIFGILLTITIRRDVAARRAAERRPQAGAYTGVAADVEPPTALRFALKWLLGACMTAVAVIVIADLHLHFFRAGAPPKLSTSGQRTLKPLPKLSSHGGGWSLHIPWGPILYALLVIALVAAVGISIWWSSRLQRPAAPLVIEDLSAEELREAVESGRAALAEISDARAAIIACYLAMERSLAERGTQRTPADTPDELLARAVAAGTVRGPAARRLTGLFYEARFSTHPVADSQRSAARAALDELAQELAAAAAAAEQAGPAASAFAGTPTKGGGRS